ncbi:MAG: enoyl-CoA hydratase/isomerase family protein [Rhodospirillum sp.]|nr:enoyl-CoA hydratase/isomerase family protein [Rhodospirillum sp.]MCF8490547.1 enoyl-CoA hydratase/isomerase family protein [Rhodospirillum sp.]MCF8500593.1 enoyl-CoA hydratase/isomerase family protein [Rhodospirillum sp.]
MVGDTPSTEKVSFEKRGDVAVITINNPPINAGSEAVRRGLLAAIQSLEEDPDLIGAVLMGAGSTFVAGSDLHEFGAPLSEPQLPAVITAIEVCPKPIVAALHGVALGGGLELALGCDARVATVGTLVGLPEVTLGIIPGAGGTQRLPRLMGIPKAIEVICSGRRVPLEEALSLGLVDKVVVGAPPDEAIAYLRKMSGMKRPVLARQVPLADEGEVDAAAAAALKAGKSRPAVVEAIRAIRSTATLSGEQGLSAERDVFQLLRVSEEAFALRHQFFAERAAAKPRQARHITPRPIETIGVVGAGTMGAGIALAALAAGMSVTLVEVNGEALDRGMARIKDDHDRRVSRGRLSKADAEDALSRLRGSATLEALATVDVIIEAVVEDLDVKKTVFAALDGIAKPGAILASNTSYLDLDAFAAATSRPEDVLGLHFFSPAQVMRLLEVVRGDKTAPDVLATGVALGKRMGKMPILARNAFGFIGNRIYAAYRRQCEFMLEEGGLPQNIDRALEAYGFAMGPFAVADMSGLDIAWHMRRARAKEGLQNPEDRYVDIPDRLCERGRFGRKSGAGYYRYDAAAKIRPMVDPDVTALIQEEAARRGYPSRDMSDTAIQDRVLLTMANEAALVVAEGVADRVEDIDLVLVNGYGFPKWRGGPVFWARGRDPRDLAARLDDLAVLSGPGFRKGDLSVLFEGRPA